MDSARSAVRRFYAYRISVSNGFYLPVSVLYLQRVRGFGLDDIGLIMAGFSAAMVVAEIPTGYVGDRLDRRTSLALGNLILAIFMAGYTIVETPLAYLALHVFWAFGWAFRSGTADAWLYELLAVEGEESEFARMRGRSSTIQMTFEAITAGLASALVVVSWSLPFLANAAVATLGIPLLLTAPSAEGEVDDAEAAEDSFTVREAITALRVQVGRADVRRFVAYATLFSVLFQVTRVFEQPALTVVGISAAELGLLYTGLKFSAAGAALTAGWVQARLGPRTLFGLLVPIWGIAFLGVAVLPVVIVPVVFLNRGLHAITRPIRNQYLNDRLADVGRATVLSGVSMVMMTAGGIAKFASGEVAAAVGLLRFLAVGGIGIAAVGGLLWVALSPVQSADEFRATDVGGIPSSD